MSQTLASKHRSPCPVACCLDLVGDRWTLLVVRDLLLGRSRFKEFAAAPEGIPTNILSERLKRLTEAGVVQKVEAAPGSRHQAYQLTPRGQALGPILEAMRDWGLQWEEGTMIGLSDLSKARE